MTRDDDLKPRLGRIGARGSKRERTYLQEILRAVALAGGRKRDGSASRSGRFHGSRIGRGAGAGRVLASRDRYAAFRSRRVIVKARIVKFAGHGLDAARVHLRYIQRDGVTREGKPGELYDATNERADAQQFLDRAEDDRHQFRFIVAAEDGAEYDELRTMVRRLMQRMEQDLGTHLDWVAVDHYNTGHPHTHVVVRGRDDRNRDLIMARDYIAHGIRERAAEIVDFDLGPRSDAAIERSLSAEVTQERFTSLDRSLVRAVDKERVVGLGALAGDSSRRALLAGRLQTLGRLGLADEIEPGRWQLVEDIEPTLRRMGERGDIIKTMNREMVREGTERAPADRVIFDPAEPDGPPLIGRVLARGLSDEINDRHFLIVDGVDGRTHYVDIGRADDTESVPKGSVVSIAPRPSHVRDVDRTVAEVAAANAGRYTIDIHLRHDHTATQSFAETHVRRLEAMRRAGVAIEREIDGTWIITTNHLDRAAAYERMQTGARPVIIEILSALPLDRQTGTDGATWLDHELIAETPAPLRHIGFGREVREALDQRRRWLIEQGLALREQDQMIYRANMLAVLRQRELLREGERLSAEIGIPYRAMRSGERVEGVYRRHVDLASGRYALIEKSREFILVPWRPVLERNLGRTVSGTPRGDFISWTLGRQRSGPGIE